MECVLCYTGIVYRTRDVISCMSLSFPICLVLIFVKAPTLLSGFTPNGAPLYGCKMTPKVMTAGQVVQ